MACGGLKKCSEQFWRNLPVLTRHCYLSDWVKASSYSEVRHWTDQLPSARASHRQLYQFLLGSSLLLVRRLWIVKPTQIAVKIFRISIGIQTNCQASGWANWCVLSCSCKIQSVQSLRKIKATSIRAAGKLGCSCKSIMIRKYLSCFRSYLPTAGRKRWDFRPCGHRNFPPSF